MNNCLNVCKQTLFDINSLSLTCIHSESESQTLRDSLK